MKVKNKPKYNMWQSICFMLRYAWKYCKQVLFLCIVIPVLELLLSLAQLYISPVILKLVEDAAPLNQLLGTIGVFSLALLLLRGLKEYVNQNVLYGRVLIRSEIGNDINRKGCITSYPNTVDPAVTGLQDKAFECCNSNNKPTEYIWTILASVLGNLFCFAAYLLLLSNLNWWLIVVILVTSTAGFLGNNRINEWSYRHREEEAAYEKQAYYLYSLMGDIALGKDMRIFGLKSWIDSIWDGVIRTCEAFVTRREKVYLWTNVIDVVLTVARNGLAYAYLIYLALNRELSASEFLLYFSAISGFATWVTGLLGEFATLRKQCLELSTVQEYLDYPEQFRFEGGIPIPDAESYELRLNNVSFRYPGSEEYIFKNLNLTVRPGENLAIVGLNGAGKSTIVKLLCGFYDPDEGSVLLNGIDIRKFNRREYYTQFSAVFQEFSHLDVTVAENVAQDFENIDLARVNDAIEKAGLTKAVAELPKGLDTPVGRDVFLDGVLFSGGQMQRLMLARALYKDGQILVLDEPTAALDPLAEQDIYMKYNEMTAGKTSVFISHRLASTRFCDRIIFLADGTVKEEGTHEELLKQNGGYAQLFEVQSRYYREGREFYGEE